MFFKFFFFFYFFLKWDNVFINKSNQQALHGKSSLEGKATTPWALTKNEQPVQVYELLHSQII